MDLRDFLLFLNSLQISNKTMMSMLHQLEDFHLLTEGSVDQIEKLAFLDGDTKHKILQNRHTDWLAIYREKLDKLNIKYYTYLDEAYPEHLRNIPDFPALIYMKGNLDPLDTYSLAVVGSRKCTDYGKWATRTLVKEIAQIGISIVSGLAYGIDKVAHETTLAAGGRTIGVLGNSLDIVYPKSNGQLYQSIEKSGCIISEFPLESHPLPYRFPMRNRIISGLSLGVLVIEAKKKSGSLITAGYAGEQGREVFAVPGNISSLFSQGTNALIRDGAKIVMDVDDILEEIYEFKAMKKDFKRQILDFGQLSQEEKMVYDALQDHPRTIDEIRHQTGLRIHQITSILTILEMKDFVTPFDNGRYIHSN